MTPRDWFIVGVRLLGLWMWLGAVGEFVSLMQLQTGMMSSRQMNPSAFLFHGIIDLLIGAMLLFGATALSSMFTWPIDGHREG